MLASVDNSVQLSSHRQVVIKDVEIAAKLGSTANVCVEHDEWKKHDGLTTSCSVISYESSGSFAALRNLSASLAREQTEDDQSMVVVDQLDEKKDFAGGKCDAALDLPTGVSTVERGVVPWELLELLESCAVITTASLSCQSLGGSFGSRKSASHDEEISAEIKISKWLDSQIADYKAVSIRKQRNVEAEQREFDASLSNVTDIQSLGKRTLSTHQQKRQLKRLKEQLFDETVRKQQEELLLHRMKMALVSSFTTFPEYATSKHRTLYQKQLRSHTNIRDIETNAAHSHACGVFSDSDAVHLQREALFARDNLVVDTLETVKRHATMYGELEELKKECSDWQQRNRLLWKEVMVDRSASHGSLEVPFHDAREKQERSGEAGLLIDKYLEPQASTALRKTRELLLLKRTLASTIIGSSIDWYSDPRLRQTMLRLGEDDSELEI